jgi:hypothetical protein
VAGVMAIGAATEIEEEKPMRKMVMNTPARTVK